MRFGIFIVLLGFICLTLAQDEGCCLQYTRKVKRSLKNRVSKYRKQDPDRGCSIPAVIFTSDHGLVLCADPRENWVRDVMRRVDGLSKESSLYTSGSGFRRSEPLDGADLNPLATPKPGRIKRLPRSPRTVKNPRQKSFRPFKHFRPPKPSKSFRPFRRSKT